MRQKSVENPEMPNPWRCFLATSLTVIMCSLHSHLTIYMFKKRYISMMKQAYTLLNQDQLTKDLILVI